jgi:serine/threonine protein kinase
LEQLNLVHKDFQEICKLGATSFSSGVPLYRGSNTDKIYENTRGLFANNKHYQNKFLMMQSFIETLSFKNQVAVGGFGKVFLAQGKEEGINYAVKSIPKSREQLQNVEREVKAGELLKNKNIVNFICSFDRDNDHHLVFDFVKGKLHRLQHFSYLHTRC